MNVNLQGARRESRLNWDAIEHRNARAQELPRKIFIGALIAIALYLAWTSYAG